MIRLLSEEYGKFAGLEIALCVKRVNLGALACVIALTTDVSESGRCRSAVDAFERNLSARLLDYLLGLLAARRSCALAPARGCAPADSEERCRFVVADGFDELGERHGKDFSTICAAFKSRP